MSRPGALSIVPAPQYWLICAVPLPRGRSRHAAFYRKYVPHCENTELVATAALMGVRESRRIVGEYELNFDDYTARRQFPDQIGVFNKFVDIHPLDCSRAEYERLREEISHSCRLGTGDKPGDDPWVVWRISMVFMASMDSK